MHFAVESNEKHHAKFVKYSYNFLSQWMCDIQICLEKSLSSRLSDLTRHV